MQGHFEQRLQGDIDLIRGKVMRMCKLAERALRDSLRALVENNLTVAYSVILRDQYIDELEKEIDRLCLEFLVRQQPVAGHLRFAYVVIKVNQELERIGDYAESVARQAVKLAGCQPRPDFSAIVELAELAIAMFRDATNAFFDEDAGLARRTMGTEEKADVLRNGINSELHRWREQERIALDAFTSLMTVARRFERVTDQSKNICEEVLYLCTGEYMKHQGTEVFRVLFVDRQNGAASQMAEGIANTLEVSRFVFASAGITAGEIDPRTVAFMTEKGIDITRQSSKSLEQIPNLEHYHLIIALDPDGRKAFRAPPTKTVGLEWNVGNPAEFSGSLQQPEVRARYEDAFRFISTHLRELVHALLSEEDNYQS